MKEDVTLTFHVSSIASYDDTGIIKKSAYVLEKGLYAIYAGTSVRDVQKVSPPPVEVGRGPIFASL